MTPLIIAVSDRAGMLTKALLDASYPSVTFGHDFDKDVIDAHGSGPLILVGKTVAEAHGLSYLPYSIACGRNLIAVLPADAVAHRARVCVAELLELAKGATA